MVSCTFPLTRHPYESRTDFPLRALELLLQTMSSGGIAKLYEVCRKLAHVPLSGYHFGGIICPKVEGVRTGMAV